MVDELTVVKVRLKNLVKNKDSMKVIEGAVQRMNLLCTHVYQFLRLWILGIDKVPEINKDVFHMAFKALTPTSKGPKPRGLNGDYYETFLKFYDDVYSKLGYQEKISALNLSTITGYTFTQMVTALENNIKSHYLEYVRRFVNSHFKADIEATCEIKDKKLRQAAKKDLYFNLKKIKDDLINSTIEAPPCYQEWISNHRFYVVPGHFQIEDLYVNPLKYLKHMIYMSKNLEKQGLKQFQFFPLRKKLIPAHITLDTRALIDLFSENKGKEFKKVTKIRDEVWGRLFHTNYKVFRRNNYSFNHMITTNGHDVSIIFRSNETYQKNEEKNKRKEEQKKAEIKLAKEKEERLKLEEELSKIECPYCHKKFSLKKEN